MDGTLEDDVKITEEFTGLTIVDDAVELDHVEFMYGADVL